MKIYAELIGNYKKFRIKSLSDNKMRKQKERLDEAMPDIINGYCSKSNQPREVAEQEVKEFVQILEDSASYQFGYNHSIAYCLLGYLCAYYRYYYPVQFITSYLNNAANDEDTKNGIALAHKLGIRVTTPKWGVARSNYFYDAEKKIISKGMESIKYLNNKVSNELYNLANDGRKYDTFMSVLKALQGTSIDTRQTEILIKIDFFSEFGNQRELLRLTELFNDLFQKGQVSQIAKEKVEGTVLEEIISRYSNSTTKAGKPAKRYTILDIDSIFTECEQKIKEAKLSDLSDTLKVQNFKEYMGYVGYCSEKEEDRRKLFVLNVYPLCRKSDGKQFGYSIITKSIGSGKESRFTVFNSVFNKDPIKENDIIFCADFTREGPYFTLVSYTHIYG